MCCSRLKPVLGIALTAVFCFFHPVKAERPKYVPHPSLDEMKQGLERWARLRPNRITIRTAGRSAGGHPILLAIVADQDVSDDEKQVALLTAREPSCSSTFRPAKCAPSTS